MTPIDVNHFVQLLNESGYDRQETQFLENGFKNGFDIGYEGPQERQSLSDNIPFTIGNKTILWNKLMKEVELKRVAGPFDQIPFENFIQSPIGLVPKSGSDETRLIFHLSYDFKTDNMKSLNFHTPKEKCSVHYKDIDYAVRTYLELYQEMNQTETESDNGEAASHTKATNWRESFDGRSHKRKVLPIFAGKSDLKSAFRILGLSRDSWKWLIRKAQDPITGNWKFFVDKCLPFGSSISCALFQKFSDALLHLINYRLNLKDKKCITNYLDDFLFIACAMFKCNFIIDQFLELCDELKVPVSLDKTECASEMMVFLGILLDGRNLLLAVPEDKRIFAVNLLEEIISKKKTMVGTLQKLCGYLKFLCRAIFPGRTFIRRMYSKYSDIIHLNGTPKNANEYKLKQHHHVKIDKEFKLDCAVWIEFLKKDMSKVVNRPMVDLHQDAALNSTEVGFYSDASATPELGFGVLLGNKWIKGSWKPDFIRLNKPSIEFLELFALTVGVIAWQEDLSNNWVRLHCDNMSVVHMINGLTSGCKNCMFLIRLLVLNGLKYNRRLTAVYINTKGNKLSDALSRNQMSRFLRLAAPEMNQYSDPILETLWRLEKVWII